MMSAKLAGNSTDLTGSIYDALSQSPQSSSFDSALSRSRLAAAVKAPHATLRPVNCLPLPAADAFSGQKQTPLQQQPQLQPSSKQQAQEQQQQICSSFLRRGATESPIALSSSPARPSPPSIPRRAASTRLTGKNSDTEVNPLPPPPMYFDDVDSDIETAVPSVSEILNLFNKQDVLSRAKKPSTKQQMQPSQQQQQQQQQHQHQQQQQLVLQPAPNQNNQHQQQLILQQIPVPISYQNQPQTIIQPMQQQQQQQLPPRQLILPPVPQRKQSQLQSQSKPEHRPLPLPPTPPPPPVPTPPPQFPQQQQQRSVNSIDHEEDEDQTYAVPYQFAPEGDFFWQQQQQQQKPQTSAAASVVSQLQMLKQSLLSGVAKATSSSSTKKIARSNSDCQAQPAIITAGDTFSPASRNHRQQQQQQQHSSSLNPLSHTGRSACGGSQAALIAQLQQGVSLRKAKEPVDAPRTPSADRVNQSGSVSCDLFDPNELPPPPPSLLLKPILKINRDFEDSSTALDNSGTLLVPTAAASDHQPHPTATSPEMPTDDSSIDQQQQQHGLTEDELASVPGYTAIPVGTPEWKRALIERKNREAVDAYLASRAEEERQERWQRAVPEWKRQLIDQRQARAREEAMPIEERRRREAEEAERLAGMPEWKRNIILKKKTQQGGN